MVEGISVDGPHRDGPNLKFIVRSENRDFDCINLNGVSGSGEVLKNEGSKDPSIVKSSNLYKNSDILYFDNRQYADLKNIYREDVTLNIDKNYKYVMFPIFNCKSFKYNIAQYVYIYTFPSI
ncbi:hypothetical protein [Novosphingobium sp.]|uniref:hypothetical protein n=1 Tax=Novosphingobium sp. TaxID=1874826 RepID=UPI002C4656E3|nr:hypothetical protein [Novosphingobium sp.]HQV02222.1 hypothetical protein [Novosphingobium sp.]